MSRKPWITVVIALVFLGLAAGVGWRLYDLGYDHGVTHEIETSATNSGASTVIVHDDYGHGHGFVPFFLIFPDRLFRPTLHRAPPCLEKPLGRTRRRSRRHAPGAEEWHKQQHAKDGESQENEGLGTRELGTRFFRHSATRRSLRVPEQLFV